MESEPEVEGLRVSPPWTSVPPVVKGLSHNWPNVTNAFPASETGLSVLAAGC